MQDRRNRAVAGRCPRARRRRPRGRFAALFSAAHYLSAAFGWLLKSLLGVVVLAGLTSCCCSSLPQTIEAPTTGQCQSAAGSGRRWCVPAQNLQQPRAFYIAAAENDSHFSIHHPLTLL